MSSAGTSAPVEIVVQRDRVRVDDQIEMPRETGDAAVVTGSYAGLHEEDALDWAENQARRPINLLALDGLLIAVSLALTAVLAGGLLLLMRGH